MYNSDMTIFYPNYKKALWQVWRAFFIAFVATLTAQAQSGVDLSDFDTWIKSVLAAAFVSGVRASMKYVREKWYAGMYDHWIYQIPV